MCVIAAEEVIAAAEHVQEQQRHRQGFRAADRNAPTRHQRMPPAPPFSFSFPFRAVWWNTLPHVTGGFEREGVGGEGREASELYQVNCVRQFYENLVPSCTVYDIDCPDNFFRKFTDDGQYLISFSRNYQELIVYRPTWLSFSCKEEDCGSHDLPPKAKRFDSFFTQLYCISLASCSELICKDFFLYVESHRFGLFATSTVQVHDAPATEGAIHGVPSIEKITFHLVRLEDGAILDEKVFCNDFVNVSHNMGVFLYDDLLCIMSLRYQAIHILQIRDSGSLVDVRKIGVFCREDDELFFSSHSLVAIVQPNGFGSPRSETDIHGK
ncbi:hypothetical protein Taro_033251 [Colocasia esculenta]|uniref:Light-mediated development protein DET1 n=1 Tax=Colocasia esculenta TaxID=4460 RepID=A0A843VUT8_COLES|nr:hypothetical protein [Colocasia esculenta]